LPEGIILESHMSRSKHRRRPPAPPDDPVELARLYALLEERLAEIDATLEAKRRQGWTFNPRMPADA